MKKIKVQCCYIGEDGKECEEDAIYVLWDGKEPAYDHKTECCLEHVGHMYNETGKTNVFYPIDWEE